MYLTDLQENEQAEIAMICDCQQQHHHKHHHHAHDQIHDHAHNHDCYIKRLADLGLIPQTVIKVVRRGLGHGPIEIQFRNNNIVVGYGLASKIKVKKIT